MNKEDLELISEYLVFQGFPEPAKFLLDWYEATNIIIENSLEFDYSNPDLFKAFEVFNKGK